MKFFFPVVLLFISGIFIFPLFQNGLFQTHDGDLQIARIAAYYKAILDGQFPVRWGSDLNFGYGHPVLIFMYPLPSYLGAFLHMMGISLPDTFKVITGVSFIFSNMAMYLFLNTFFKNRLTAFMGALVYGVVPYKFLNMYVRGDIGEEAAFIFIPLVLLALTKLFEKNNEKYIFLGGIFYALLILSHNGLALIFSPILFGFFLVSYLFNKDKKYLMHGFVLFISGLFLSAFFWIPALWESRFTQAKILIGSMFVDHFPNMTQLIYSRWGFGPDVNKPGGLSPQVGQLQLILTLVSLPALFINKNKKNIFALYFLCIFVISIFLMTTFSKFVWQTVPFLPFLQFPWRVNAAVLLCASFISTYAFSTNYFKKIMDTSLGKMTLVIVLVGVIYVNLPFTKTMEHKAVNEDYYLNFTGDTTFHGQTNSIWTDSNKNMPSKSPIEIIGGEVEVEGLFRSSTKHSFVANVKKDAQILDNTVYFPGWQVKVDGKKVPIEFQDMNHRGLITFYISKGVRMVNVEFKESPIRLISDMLSLISALSILLFLIFQKKLNWIWRSL